MNSFKLYINDYEETGVVFTFRYSELLDERLDEAYVDIYNSYVEAYAPTSDVRVEIYQNNALADTQHYIVSNDNSTEYPIGSRKYKHTIHLLERTKLLDGIVCSALTFTNVMSDSDIIPAKTIANLYEASIVKDFCNKYAGLILLEKIYFGLVPSFVGFETDLRLPSVDDVGKDFEPLTPALCGEGLKYMAERNFQYDHYESYYKVFNCSDCDGDHKITSDGGYECDVLVTYATDSTILSAETLKNVSQLRVDYYIHTNSANDAYLLEFFIDVEKEKNYAAKRYTITDCINRILECAPYTLYNHSKQTPQYVLDGVIYEDGISSNVYKKGSQSEKYANIIAPEFTLPSGTLREQLKMIGAFIHAEPYVEYPNIIKFLPLSNQSKCSLSNKQYVYASAKTDITQYHTSIRTNAKNIVSSDNEMKIKEVPQIVRTETQYIKINEDNAVAMTDFPIYSVVSVKCGILDNDGQFYIDMTDITSFVFEKTVYDAHLSSYAGSYPFTKEFAIYYTRGEKNIKELFFEAPHAVNQAKYSPFSICNILEVALRGTENKKKASDIKEYIVNKKLIPLVFFQIEYIPLMSAYLSFSKNLLASGNNYEQIYNQGENLIESRYFGEHMKGIAARLGNQEEERTYLLKNISDVPKIDQTLDEYAISAVNTEIMPYHIKCTLGLSKDYNRISEYIGINNVKRLYQIPENNIEDRRIVLRDKLIVTRHSGEYYGCEGIVCDLDVFGAGLSGYYHNHGEVEDVPINVAIFRGYNKKKN